MSTNGLASIVPWWWSRGRQAYRDPRKCHSSSTARQRAGDRGCAWEGRDSLAAASDTATAQAETVRVTARSLFDGQAVVLRVLAGVMLLGPQPKESYVKSTTATAQAGSKVLQRVEVRGWVVPTSRSTESEDCRRAVLEESTKGWTGACPCHGVDTKVTPEE